jgi:NAD(P)-dependent dehydrogenase (short-subunit alcohol dehydrogenase family)
MSKIWFITGASRGLGLDVARAALAAGDKVVATSRRADAVTKALGAQDAVLAVELDVTKRDQPQKAIAAAVERFGRIDVLVNNAGYSLFGALEECSPEEIETQYATNVLGVIAVTRAALPVLRKQRSGHIVNVSSLAGMMSAAGMTLYCSSKFALEGLSEGLAAELAPFGIKLTIVEPGAFRTDFLADSSAVFSAGTIDDYETTITGEVRRACKAFNGSQGGDPVKLANAIVRLANEAEPPLRFAAGRDAVEGIESVLENRRKALDAWRDLSLSMALETETQ